MARNLLTVRQFCQRNPAFTEGQLRFYIFKADENGLAASGALVRICPTGKDRGRVLLDEDRFFDEWIDGQQPHRKATA